ncbi:hypothetical protein HanHA300_Chr13g0501121 [Helianthus annuus]|nr:hypothetical protein HanHA300_Chr13g0501121 [Helianthus annuus]KAJ0499421.1 hypothetical protein HanHA89_Chr13g0533871 [Helianthus annuus]KAJ0665441.1 hypothetical protein HanLR1_Chr13g0503961 [Helianthus annuus]
MTSSSPLSPHLCFYPYPLSPFSFSLFATNHHPHLSFPFFATNHHLSLSCSPIHLHRHRNTPPNQLIFRFWSGMVQIDTTPHHIQTLTTIPFIFALHQTTTPDSSVNQSWS